MDLINIVKLAAAKTKAKGKGVACAKPTDVVAPAVATPAPPPIASLGGGELIPKGAACSDKRKAKKRNAKVDDARQTGMTSTVSPALADWPASNALLASNTPAVKGAYDLSKLASAVKLAAGATESSKNISRALANSRTGRVGTLVPAAVSGQSQKPSLTSRALGAAPSGKPPSGGEAGGAGGGTAIGGTGGSPTPPSKGATKGAADETYTLAEVVEIFDKAAEYLDQTAQLNKTAEEVYDNITSVVENRVLTTLLNALTKE